MPSATWWPAARGDEAAFARVVDAWSPMLLRVARTFVSTDASAQEVVQETWLAVVTGPGPVRGPVVAADLGLPHPDQPRPDPRRPRGALGAAVLLLAAGRHGPTVDPRRFRGADDAWPHNWTPVGSPRPWQPSPEDAAVAGEIRGEVARALTGLPERQRTVVSPARRPRPVLRRGVCGPGHQRGQPAGPAAPRSGQLRTVLEDYYRGRDGRRRRDRPTSRYRA